MTKTSKLVLCKHLFEALKVVDKPSKVKIDICLCTTFYMSSEPTQSLSTSTIRFNTILSAAQTTGEDEKAAQGD